MLCHVQIWFLFYKNHRSTFLHAYTFAHGNLVMCFLEININFHQNFDIFGQFLARKLTFFVKKWQKISKKFGFTHEKAHEIKFTKSLHMGIFDPKST